MNRRSPVSSDAFLVAVAAQHLAEGGQLTPGLQAVLVQTAEKNREASADMLRLLDPIDRKTAVQELWEAGMPKGFRTGWRNVDEHYTVVPGQVTIVTGWPGSGKSEWVDALVINLMRQGWRFAVCSPENTPVELHLAKWMEKLAGKPFGAGPTERMSADEAVEWVDEISQRARFLDVSERQASIPDVLAAATEWRTRVDGPFGLVLDPWNEFEHSRPSLLSETEYVSQTLSSVRTWARAHKAHVWIVAHPQKMRRNDSGDLPVPRPDMISGSQHWWNKADCAITVYRDLARNDNTVEIHVQKVRFKHVGKVGLVALTYNRITGTYHDFSRGMEVVA